LTTLLTEEKIKSLIIEIVAKEKPQNTEKLMQLILQNYSIPPESTSKVLIALENEGKLHFIKPKALNQISVIENVFSRKTLWYWEIIALSIVTTISVLTIPETAYLITYVRSVLGITFVIFLPGYAFVKAIFPTKVSINISSEKLSSIERIALSIGMSLSIVTIVGVVLNYTPWGIRLAPITLILLVLTIICATTAVFREHQFQKI
jgi:uncharacterized membrane protein